MRRSLAVGGPASPIERWDSRGSHALNVVVGMEVLDVAKLRSIVKGTGVCGSCLSLLAARSQFLFEFTPSILVRLLVMDLSNFQVPSGLFSSPDRMQEAEI